MNATPIAPCAPKPIRKTVELSPVEMQDIARALHSRGNAIRGIIQDVKQGEIDLTNDQLYKFINEIERMNNLLQGKFLV